MEELIAFDKKYDGYREQYDAKPADGGFGSEVSLLGRHGWFVENSGKHVHPPKKLRPTIRGLFDLHGNTFEWTHDWYGSYAQSPVTDTRGADEGSNRVRRGGSWTSAAVFCRAANRSSNAPTNRSISNGFRLALSFPPAKSPEAEENK